MCTVFLYHFSGLYPATSYLAWPFGCQLSQWIHFLWCSWSHVWYARISDPCSKNSKAESP